VINFLEACRNQDYRRAVAYLDQRDFAAGERAVEGPELARQLEQILDRNVEFDPGSLSRNPEGDTGVGGHETVAKVSDDDLVYQIDLERIQPRSNSPEWQFSANSVALIPRLYKLAGESAFERRPPERLVSWRFFDTALWRWLALALLAAVLVALSSLLSRGLMLLARSVLRRVAAYLHTELLEAIVGPLRLLVSIAVFRAGMEIIGPSALLRLYIGRALAFLFAIGVAWAAMRLIDVLLARIRFVLATDHANPSSSILSLVSKVLKSLIFMITFTAILATWGYSTTTLLAAVGVGGLAVALAARRPLKTYLAARP
jgi:MscS family membrane protein